MINLAALGICLWLNEYGWMDAIVALIIKLAIVKVRGVKALEEKVLLAVVGFCTGYGAPLLFVALREIFLKVLPSYGYAKLKKNIYFYFPISFLNASRLSLAALMPSSGYFGRSRSG